jgi:Domain of unknown function (DUF4394)
MPRLEEGDRAEGLIEIQAELSVVWRSGYAITYTGVLIMQLKKSTAIGALALAAVSLLNLAGPATATTPSSMPIQLVGLTNNNQLVTFRTDRSRKFRSTRVKGVDGKLVGIDVRPANGLLYGLTNTDKIYTIDPMTGATKLISTLSTPFNGNIRTGIDFNPVPDRLRLVNAKGQNFRVNVDTGMVTVDQPLKYAANDPSAGKTPVPQITAAAYTNAFAGPPSPTGVTPPTRTTQLLDIDSAADVLVLQNPPNDGVLTTIGALGIDFKPTGEFDIFSPRDGVNLGFAVSGSTFYAIDLKTGAASPVGSAGRGITLIGLTFTLAPVAEQ